MTIHNLLRKRLLEQAGLAETPARFLRLQDLEQSEWSDAFERLMRNRLIMGALRYGLMHGPRPDYDYISDTIRRLQAYQESGNTEHLVDVANLCLLAFELDRHPKKHFASGDDGEHCKIK